MRSKSGQKVLIHEEYLQHNIKSTLFMYTAIFIDSLISWPSTENTTVNAVSKF